LLNRGGFEIFQKKKKVIHLKIAQGLIWYEYNFDYVFPVSVIEYRKTGEFCGHSLYNISMSSSYDESEGIFRWK